jgi:hypothetical protein
MNIPKSVVTQRLLHAAFDEIGGCGHPRGAQIRASPWPRSAR